MSDSGILDRNMTESEMRAKILRDDRAGWYPGEDPKHVQAIISRKGRVVARCESLHDRDFLLRAAWAHDDLVAALELLLGVRMRDHLTDQQTLQIAAALVKARAE